MYAYTHTFAVCPEMAARLPGLVLIIYLYVSSAYHLRMCKYTCTYDMYLYIVCPEGPQSGLADAQARLVGAQCGGMVFVRRGGTAVALAAGASVRIRG